MENEKIKPEDKLISPHIFDLDLTQILKKSWNCGLDKVDKNVSVITKPFMICKLNNFLQKPLGTYDLRGELLSVHNRKRGNDLMKLEESVCDLQDITPQQTYSQNIECIKLLCEELLSDFKPWLSQITGIELNEKLSIRTSTYTDTDFLLCHNDQIEDRQIAFILYLSKDWKEEYGGQLNLFDSNFGKPTEIVTSLLPEFNSLVFFRVTDSSFHSVAEILKNVSRFSVNGWFHGTRNITNLPLRIEETICKLKPQNSIFDLTKFISETRLSNKIFIEIINKVIETTSFCGIKKYFKENQYKNLLQDITSDKITWTRVGPPDEKNYEVAEYSTLPPDLQNFYNMFQNVSFCQLLKNYTDLQLVPGESQCAKLTITLQRWHQGSYTVLHDGLIREKSDEELTTELQEEEEEEEEVTVHRPQRLKKGKYTVKDMLEDIIVDSNDISKILPFLSSSVIDEMNNEPMSSGSSSHNDNGPAPKIRKLETKDSDDEDMQSETKTESDIKGTLDVILYFFAENAPEGTTLNYVDPSREDGVFLTLPIDNNCLFIVYRQEGVVRHNEYVNHYCKGNFYSLVCSYTE